MAIAKGAAHLECGRINVNDPRNVAFWSRRFRITPQQLRRAVKQVGTEPRVLGAYLGKPAPVPRRKG